MLQETCWALAAFGSTLQQVLSVTGTGLITRNSQVSLCLCLSTVGMVSAGEIKRFYVLLYYSTIYLNVISENALMHICSF